jgi:drug/metabolite transporter (DMT)-like permease
MILFIVLCLIWGTTWLAIKIGLDDLPPFLSSALRFVVAFSVLVLVKVRRGRDRRGEPELHRFYFFLSFFWVTIPYGLVYWGEQYVSSGLSAILFATMPFYVAFFSHVALPGERLDVRTVAGLLIGFLGLAIIFFESAHTPASGALRGIVALILSPLAAAIANVAAKRRIATLDPVTMNLWMMGYGAVFLLAISLVMERGTPVDFSRSALLTLIYLGVFGSALAFVLYTYLLKMETALKMSLIVYITPVIALFAGWFIRDETITAEIVAGSGLVFLGVYMVSRRGGPSTISGGKGPPG